MSPRRYTRRSAPALPDEVPEQVGSDEVRELRAQVAVLTGAMRQQGEQIGRLHELVARQAAAAAPVSQDPPAPAAPTPVAAAPVTPISRTASGSSAPILEVLEAEQERSLAVLTAFKRFNPPTFAGNVKNPWMMESWLFAMEALFEDIYTLEKDKVRLAAHCLEGPARSWWTRVKNGRSLDPTTMTWEAFREILLMEYFPESDKRKIKKDFCKLRQESRSVREYEREFLHMVDCVPGLVHGDRDRAEVFEHELRPEIFKTVHALWLKTYEEVLDRALWVERGNAIARKEREAFERDKDKEKSKKRPAGGSTEQSSSKRPPRYLRSQWQTIKESDDPLPVCDLRWES
ncbi:uncharacterized protein LOC109704235 [Ananas comosus]|uniref:Uncharacterized protein LOC109704235 n=1 Tax=Ananas comosus TaxID=4615 RepID=A0A6P5EB99_ANACO|nr:uncharacterized protein LOC109704235 [Ananas comosus]